MTLQFFFISQLKIIKNTSLDSGQPVLDILRKRLGLPRLKTFKVYLRSKN